MPQLEVTGRVCLSASPELKRLEGGRLLVRFRAAANHAWTDKETGQKKEDPANWRDFVAWDRVAAQIEAAQLQKGSWVHFHGCERFWYAIDQETGERRERREIKVDEIYLLPPKV